MGNKRNALILDFDGVLWSPMVAFLKFCSTTDRLARFRSGATKALYDQVRKEAEGSSAMGLFFSRLSKESLFGKEALESEYLQHISESGRRSIKGMALSKFRELEKAAKFFDLVLLTAGQGAVQLEKIDAFGEKRKKLFAEVIVTSSRKTPYVRAILESWEKAVVVDDKISEIERIDQHFKDSPGRARLGLCWYDGVQELAPPGALAVKKENLLTKVHETFEGLRREPQ